MTTEPKAPPTASVPISKRLVTINAASAVIAKLVNMTVLLWLYQYLLRRIPAEEFAVLPVVTAMMVFAPLFFSFFTGGISRYVVNAYAKNETERVTAIVSSIFPPLAAAAVLFLCVGGLFALNIEKVLNIVPHMVPQARIMMILLVVTFSLQMLALPFGPGFHVRQHFVELNLLGIGRSLIRIVLLFVFLLGIGPQVIWVVVATVISDILYTAVTVVRSRAKVPELVFRAKLFTRSQAWELMNFGLWTTVGQLGFVLGNNAATIILNLSGSAVDVNSFYIGSIFYGQLDNLIGIAAQPLQPVLTAMDALKDHRRLGETVFRGGRYALWVGMVAATPLAIFSDCLINLYLGETYASAATVVILFMLIVPFGYPTILLPQCAMAMARVRVFFLPAFLVQLVQFPLMLWVAVEMKMGAVGITMVMILAAITSQLLYFWPLCLKLTGLGFREFKAKVLLPGLVPALGGAMVWGALKLVAPPESWIELIIYTLAGALVYGAVLLRCLDGSEKRDLRAILTRFGIVS